MKSKEIFKITKIVSTLVRIFMLVIAALLITSTVYAQTEQTPQGQHTIDPILLSAIANIITAFIGLLTVIIYIKHTLP